MFLENGLGRHFQNKTAQTAFIFKCRSLEDRFTVEFGELQDKLPGLARMLPTEITFTLPSFPPVSQFPFPFPFRSLFSLVSILKFEPEP